MNQDPQQDPSGDPIVTLKVSSSVEDPSYWKILVIELMKRIPLGPPAPLVPPKNSSKLDKLANRVARHNHKAVMETLTM